MNLPDYPYPGDENARADVESGAYARHYTFKDGDMVLDIGAHVGFFSEWVLPKLGPGGLIISIEPHPRNYDELCKRMSGKSNCVTIEAAACSWPDETVELINNSHNSGAHTVFPKHGPPWHFSITVKTINIGQYCWELPRKPNFVKIDTEGAEFEVLSSLFDFDIRPEAFAMECHCDDLYKTCKSLLDSKGYRTIKDGDMLFGNRT